MKQMNQNYLFVSDLDGTLMKNDGTLSEYTIRTVNELVERGMAFTFATARSIESARVITEKLKLQLPVITRNGAVIADNATGKHLEKAFFSNAEVALLKELLPELPRCGCVSCFIGDKMIRTYIPIEHTTEFQGYLDYSKNASTIRPVSDIDELFCGVPGYVTMIGRRDEIAPIYERVKKYNDWECIFQKDTYLDEYWLEICPQNCTKAKSILKLKEKLCFEKLVVFGDSINDVSMFQVADEAYAVKNAIDELKNIATAVIGSNEEDAVVKLLRERV